MGEIQIKSGNLFDTSVYNNTIGSIRCTVTSTLNSITIEATGRDPYVGAYFPEGTSISVNFRSLYIPVKPNTSYTLNMSSAPKCYWLKVDENNISRGGGEINALPFSFATDEFTKYVTIRFGNGNLQEGDSFTFENIQLLEGTYTSETIPEYQPYFLNRPAHQFVNGQWVDIPTHHYTNNRWQGELTSQSPLEFRATGQSLLDWRIEGKTNSEPETIVYGIHIDPSIQDPSNAVTYLEDAVGMTPASMGSTTFNSGSWADAFFMPKPCMVRYDGTVDYYLDPLDYSKKTDGTPSDVDNINYDGNAMMEWPLIWYKYDTDGCVEGEVNFYVSNKQVDESCHCCCNYDADGNIIPHFYTAIYNGTSAPTYSTTATYSVGDRVTYSSGEYECNTEITTGEAWDSSKWTLISDTTRLRSLSGVQLTADNGNGNTSGTIEIDRSTANNTTTKTEWYTDILADRELINMLLVLIGKSLNAQAVFGRGLDTGGQSVKEAYVTGTLDDKGLFWGVTGNGTNAVKVFGMENYWGCVWHRIAGMVSIHDATTNSNNIKIKLTHSTVDGTDVSGFNSNGNGYIDTGVEADRAVELYIRKMKYFDKGYTPLLTTGGSSTTYYSDYTFMNYVGTYYLLTGGYSGNGLRVGPFHFNLGTGFSYSHWDIAAVLSLKPQAKTPYEPYGGVGDWDETTQRYKIPVTVNGTTTTLYTDHQLMDGDSIDYATDQTAIPIATGNNILTVDTAVQPKTVFVKFEG